jgi:hypothetical protein
MASDHVTGSGGFLAADCGRPGCAVSQPVIQITSPVDGRVAMFISENASELWAIDVSEAALQKKDR